MDIKMKIIESLQNASLDKVLDRNDIDTLEWFWINRDIFEDVLRNIPGFDYYAQEEEVAAILENMKEEEFIIPLREEIEKRGFMEMSQELFAKLDKRYRIVEEVKTWIFIKGFYYNKLWIKKYNKLEWVLKAMAINTYQRLDTEHTSLLETYQDLFENNNRLLEEIVEKEVVVLERGKWILNEKEGSLTFYKNNKPFYEWAQGEVESKFSELQIP